MTLNPFANQSKKSRQSSKNSRQGSRVSSVNDLTPSLSVSRSVSKHTAALASTAKINVESRAEMILSSDSDETEYQMSKRKSEKRDKGRESSTMITVEPKKTVTTGDSRAKLHPLRDINFYSKKSDSFDSSSDSDVDQLSKDIQSIKSKLLPPKIPESISRQSY